MSEEIRDLLARYDEWDQERQEFYEREEDNPVSSSSWESSDDEGANLAHELAAALRRVVDA